jgi:uncharacterized membrane protein
VLVGVMACIAVLAAWLGLTWPLLKAWLGWPLVVFVPGYALTAALFPPRTLGVPERLLFSVALSLVLTMLGSLALYALHVGLRPMTWALLLAAVTLCASLVAWRRRKATGPAAPAVHLSLAQGGVLTLAGLAVAAAVALARVPSSPAGLEGYTLLWILPNDAAPAPRIQLGVSSMEFTPTRYHLLVTLDGQVIYDWAEIDLGPGEKWAELVAVPDHGSGLGQVEALLYRLDNPDVVYRRATLWQGQVSSR